MILSAGAMDGVHTAVAGFASVAAAPSRFKASLCRGLTMSLQIYAFNRSALAGLGDFVVRPQVLRLAQRSLSHALSLQPTDADAAAAHGAIVGSFGMYGRGLARARRAFDVALGAQSGHYLALLARGLMASDAESLRKAASVVPLRTEAWLALGHLLGNAPELGAGVQQDLPGGPVRSPRQEEAAEAFRRALRLDPGGRLVVAEAGEGLHVLGEEAEAARLFHTSVQRGLWHHVLQRPRRAFWLGLRSEPFPGREMEVTCQWCRVARELVEESMRPGKKTLRDEFLAAKAVYAERNWATGTAYVIQKCKPNVTCRITPPGKPRGLRHRGAGTWREYSVYALGGMYLKDRLQLTLCASNLFPLMCALAAELQSRGMPLVRMSITEVHPPYTHIPLHSGQHGRIRLICPLVVPRESRSQLVFPGHAELQYGAESRGRCTWFDESFEHEVYYRGRRPRASLILDAPHPALAEKTPEGSWAMKDVELSSPGHTTWDLLTGPLAALSEALQCKGRLGR